MLEGMIMGALSAVLSAAVVALVYGRVVAAIGDGLAKVLSVSIIPAGDLSLILLGIFLVIGIGIGAMGSMVSMRRFLDV
jgi:cell division transport system permease protein